MTDHIPVVRAEWDSEARVWYAYSDDIPGLATGADTLEDLIEKLRIVVPELLEENGLRPRQDVDIPYHVIAQRFERIRSSA